MRKPAKEKIFCISFQRTGTTSVGRFFKDHGFKVAGYDPKRSTDWSVLRFTGDYEAIFASEHFKKNQVFEDNPWWEEDFYKFLYHRFPGSKFVLLTRNSDNWFNSMLSHSGGKAPGNSFRHAKIYRREVEFYRLFPEMDYYERMSDIDNLLDLGESHRSHYVSLYETRNKEIKDFFDAYDPAALFSCCLEDEEKWIKMGAFFNIEVTSSYDSHVNKSKTT